jgi:predicted dehydrogenase
MATALRIGVIGLSHDHVWDHLGDLTTSENVVFVGAAEKDEQLRAKLEHEYSSRTWAHWNEMLEAVELDAVFVYASNREGAEASVVAADRGLHVMIEKPMAATFAGAQAMLASASRAGTALMVNWPFAWWPQMQQALAAVEDGLIGRVWQVKYRAAHAGPAELGCSHQFCDWLFDEGESGGGAMMDYCCYGTTLARVIIGKPEQVIGISGRFCKTELPVEDNAIIVMKTGNSMATAEASWTQIGKMTSYTTSLYGTTGTLLVEPRQGGRLLLSTETDPEGSALPVVPQDPHMASATEHFVHHIRTGDELLPLCRADICCDSQEILEAGKESMKSGQQISLPLASQGA